VVFTLDINVASRVIIAATRVIMAYTIKQLADLAGITTRTLRYYDEIGLLKPTGVGENGYRRYDHSCLMVLQQILFLRELDVSLKDIHKIIHHTDFDVLQALEGHRQSLREKVTRFNTLIETIGQTITALRGE